LGDAFLRHLIDACKGEIEARNRAMGIFTSTGWKNVVSKFAEKFSDRQTKKQLKNKLDVLKKRNVQSLWSSRIVLLVLEGMQKKTVDCSQEWWDEHLAVSTVLSLYIYFFPVICCSGAFQLV